MTAKKFGLWIFDTIVFAVIAIYRCAVGYKDAHYYQYGSSWYQVGYGGSTHYDVYDEPFFIICMVIMGVFLIVSLIDKFRKEGNFWVYLFKWVAYIAAIISVSYMYSGDWDWLVVIVVGLIAVTMEGSAIGKEKTVVRN